MVKVSVVVCAKNEEKYLEPCLKALKAQTIKPEIIVVNGHSTDKTIEIAKKYADKIVKDNKKGIGEARDIGAEISSGEIIAYCDADAVPPKEWVKKILNLIKDVDCVSGSAIPYDGPWHLKANLNFWAGWIPQIATLFGFHNVWGFNMALRKHVFKKCKFKYKFLEDFYMGEQLRKAKFKCKFSKKLAIPISSRRFWKEGFYELCSKYYIGYVLKEKIIGERSVGYFQ
ncbi:glycosyltransferase [Candidatus Woesearchaeota archaeon]|nr:glycosyltransferase [Candidatus Woesearchaeota archaeon]